MKNRSFGMYLSVARRIGEVISSPLEKDLNRIERHMAGQWKVIPVEQTNFDPIITIDLLLTYEKQARACNVVGHSELKCVWGADSEAGNPSIFGKKVRVSLENVSTGEKFLFNFSDFWDSHVLKKVGSLSLQSKSVPFEAIKLN